MNKIEKYDELENIIDTLDTLADETTDKYYKDMINELKYEAQDERDSLKEEIEEEEKAEQKELEREYNSIRI